MERAEIMSQILAILEDVAEIAPEDVNENSVLMDDLDLSSMEIPVSYTHLRIFLCNPARMIKKMSGTERN